MLESTHLQQRGAISMERDLTVNQPPWLRDAQKQPKAVLKLTRCDAPNKPTQDITLRAIAKKHRDKDEILSNTLIINTGNGILHIGKRVPNPKRNSKPESPWLDIMTPADG